MMPTPTISDAPQSVPATTGSGSGWIPLTQLSRGQSGRVRIDERGLGSGSDEVKMLRAMGLRPNASVTMCRLGEPCIVTLSGACGGGCRIGLARAIADRVMVNADE